MDTATVGLIVTVLVNVAGIVWGAATLSASVKQLKESTERMDQTVRDVGERVSELDTRVSVLEDRDQRVRR